MDPVFANSKYSECYDLYRLLLNCSDLQITNLNNELTWKH